MNLAEAIAVLVEHVPDPSRGLPDEVFYYISQTTPLVNVDLLIQDENRRTLLSWRDDRFSGRGWHLPGGIVRWRETLQERIQKVAETEIGTSVRFDHEPVVVSQAIRRDDEVRRSHFISLLYRCQLSGSFVPENKGLEFGEVGYVMWHNSCPGDLIPAHEMYKKYI